MIQWFRDDKMRKICHGLNPICSHFRKKWIRCGRVAGLMEGLTLHNGCPRHFGWWWYELVEICMFFHLQFKSCQKLLTHACTQSGSLQQDSQEQKGPIPSMHTSVCCQFVLFSTITLLNVFRGEKMKLTEKIKQIQEEKKKTKFHYFCHCNDTCLHFLFVYMRGDMWELWLHLKTRNLSQEAGWTRDLGHFAESNVKCSRFEGVDSAKLLR